MKVKALRQAKQNLVSSVNATSYTTVTMDPELQYALVTPLPLGKTINDVFPNGITVSRAGAGAAPGKYLTSALPSSAGQDERAANNYAATITAEESSNFSVTLVSDVFIITEKIVPTLVPTDHVITEGTSLSGQLNTVAHHLNNRVPGVFVYSYESSPGTVTTLRGAEVLPAGNYYITVSFTPSDLTTYFGAVETVMNVIVTRLPDQGPIILKGPDPSTSGGKVTKRGPVPSVIKPTVTNAASQCIEDPATKRCRTTVVIPDQGVWTLKNGTATFVPEKGFKGKSIVVHRVTSDSGTVARANLEANYGGSGRPPVSITIPNFLDGSPVITNTIARKITAFVKKYPDYKYIECVGYTEGPTVLPTDKWLSKQRALNSCAFVKNTLKMKFIQRPARYGQDTIESSQRRRVVITLSD